MCRMEKRQAVLCSRFENVYMTRKLRVLLNMQTEKLSADPIIQLHEQQLPALIRPIRKRSEWVWSNILMSMPTSLTSFCQIPAACCAI